MSWFDHYRRGVEPSRQALARITRRLEGEVPTHTLIRRLADVDPSAVARVTARLERPARKRRTWVFVPVVVVALAAAVITWPESLRAGAIGDETVALSSNVRVTSEGSGVVGGTAPAPEIRWEHGTITVDVTPDQGVDLHVRTEEADVHVIGTRFTVTRDRLGTAVTVDRGHVAVACRTGETFDLRAGGEAECLPTRAVGLLDRARALVENGADSARVLPTLDAGLPLADDRVVRDELQLLRAEALTRDARWGEALTGIDTALAEPGGVRRTELLRLGARAALSVEGCPGVVRRLEQIPTDERGATDEVAIADCVASASRERARAALASARAKTTDAALLGRIDARIRALVADP